MSFTVSALDIHYLIKEIAPLVDEAFVDKIYQSKEEKGELLIRLRSPKTGKQQLFFKVPEAFFLTEHKFQWPQDPAGFCMQLRKHLSNAHITAITQYGFDRILILDFAKGPIKWRLIIELFSKGNIVLVNEEGLIRGVMDLQRWSDRELRVNVPYEFPKGNDDPRLFSAQDIKKLFPQIKKPLVKFCATSLGLGGKYAEELVARTKLDKNADALSLEEAKLLHKEFQSLFKQKVKPCVDKTTPAPFSLQSLTNPVEKESFCIAVEELVVTEKVVAVEKENKTVANKGKDKWQRVIDDQTKLIKGYEKSAVENQRKGELIYEKYQELTKLMEKINALQEADGWPKVKEFIKENKLPIKVDEKNAKIVFELKEES